MGKHKKNKPTPEALNQQVEEINEVFREEEKMVDNLEDMPLPLNDIDPVEMKQLPNPEFEKSIEPKAEQKKEGVKSFSDMLRERRAKRSKI